MKRPLGDLLLTGGASFFACWTLYCYAVVLSGAGFHDLVTWSFIPVVGALVLAKWCTDPRTTSNGINAAAAPSPSATPRAYPWLIATLAIAVAVLFRAGAPYGWTWAVLLCTAALAARTAFTSGAMPSAPPVQYAWLPPAIGAAALALACAVLTAVTHRSDLDDSQYLNFVVTALDFPMEPLFSHSGLWADHSTPLELPLYRFHSYELLIAALSYATGLDHKIFYYLVLPPVFAAAAAMVHWRIAQHLLPRHALACVLAWLVLLVALGETHRAFGNFAFVRLYQGKGVLVTVALPLCLLSGLKFSQRPGPRRALALATAVIASIGLSSSALATVPVMLAAVLSGGLVGASRTAIRNIVVGGFAASLLLLAVTVYVMTTMNIGEGLYGDIPPSAGNGLSIVLGDGILGAIVLALFPLASLFASERRARQIYATTTLFFTACVLNPWASPFFARMFDLAIQWRLFWSVPLVISAAMSLVGLAALIEARFSRAWYLVALPALLLAVLMGSERWSIASDNNVTIARPHYKVEFPDYQLAAEIARLAPPRSTVYAPTKVAAWLATFRHHPYPLVFRPDYFYFGRIQRHVGFRELNRRLSVVRYLEGDDTQFENVVFFAQQLLDDQPSIVAYADDIPAAEALGPVLERTGYTGRKSGSYWLWQLH